jgi:hypothetical protein
MDLGFRQKTIPLTAKKKGGPRTRRRWTALHAGYPESGDLLPLFFFLSPPLGLLRPR